MGILRGRNQPRVRMSAIWEVGRDMLAAGVGSSLLYRRGCSVKQLAGVCKQSYSGDATRIGVERYVVAG